MILCFYRNFKDIIKTKYTGPHIHTQIILFDFGPVNDIFLAFSGPKTKTKKRTSFPARRDCYAFANACLIALTKTDNA